MRVTFVFSGGINMTVSYPSDPRAAAQKLINEQGYTCDTLSFNDTLNVLNVSWSGFCVGAAIALATCACLQLPFNCH